MITITNNDIDNNKSGNSQWTFHVEALISWSNCNLESVDFCGGRKTGGPGEKPSEQGRELKKTNSTHMRRQV